MITWLNDLLAGNSSFMPHGACYLWLPLVLWMHVIADSVIAVAYYSIPFALFYFVKKRVDLAYRWVFVLFAVFILLCGTTHLMSIWTIWHPDYWIEGLIKIATALVSIITAILVWPLIPTLLQIPSPQALQDSETYLRAVFNAAPDAMLISNEQGIITMANQQAERLLGYPVNELLGLSIEALMPEAVRSIHPMLREQFAASGNSRMMGVGRSVKALCKNGSELDVEISLSPIKTTQGLFFASALRDITDRLYSEAKLRASEERFRRVTNSTPAMVWITDTFGEPVFVNQSWLDFTGLTSSQALNHKNWIETIHPDDRNTAFASYYQNTENQQSISVEYRLRNAAGDWHWFLDMGVPFYDEKGEFSGYIGSAIDITERKQSEWLLNKLNAMVEVSLEGFWIVDMKGNILQVNEAYSKMIGYSIDELLNMHVSQLDVIDGSEQVKARMEKIISLKTCDKFESQHRHKDGHLIDVEVSVAFLSNFEQFCAFFRDISERKRYEKEIQRLSESALNKAKLDAEKASRAKSDFLSSMSHELRTPMNAVLGFAQLLACEDLTEEQHDSVQEILTAGHHLLDLINEVLDLSKIESENLNLKLEKVDLNMLLQTCIALVQSLTLKNNIQIIDNISPTGQYYIRADVMRFKQILLNLISNAIKYNRVNGCLTLFCEVTHSKTLKVNVADTGNGLSVEQIAKLFQPFERLSAKNSNIEGTGIGLVICKKLIEAMGGQIGVNSAKGVGSCFWIEIPLA